MAKLFIFILSNLLVIKTQATETTLSNFRFVEALKIEEKSNLPPKLEMTLEIYCNEKFAKLIRHEVVNPKTNETTIALGGLVFADLLSSCAGVKKIIKIDAGSSYSGRKYELTKIKI